MAGLRIVTTVRSNQFGKLAKSLPGKAGQIVGKTAAEIEAAAKARSRVDTGAMRAGWQSRMTSATSAEVTNPVEHAIYNEYGTARLAAQPMLGPASEAARPGFEAAVRRALTEL